MSTSKQVIVSGGFDDIKSRDLRFLEEAAKLGYLNVLLWTDSTIQQTTGKPPKFPLAERSYFLNAVRYVSRVVQLGGQASSNCDRLRSAADERGKWSGGRRAAFSESQPERNGPPPGRRRKPAAIAVICQCRP
jgi:hypothetical protein